VTATDREDASMKLEQITLHRLRLPLARPYKVAFAVYDAFCPIVAEVRSRDDRVGWGESLIAPGYTHETPEAGWV
jgi:L-alanine-DL-glutamate epimerase-like enolase superfamily enzyme